jgi:asparagine synthase (glutamine-hydrolysing)
MLHTTPESLHEVLPKATQNGTVIITADARIDNREELTAQLYPDYCSDSPVDSELILAAYERWEEACVNHLVGDFAFAIWDEKKQRLFCARDHFGIKPFYYHHQVGKLFAFGSEIKAILQVNDVPERLNELRIADYLAGNREDAESTIYEDIWMLPEAHALAVDRQGLRLWRYYELAPAGDVPVDASDEWYERRFRELFTEAVRCRLRSAFPVGSQLSGGMDSSAVTCVARDLAREEGNDLHTFSLVFDKVPECDERPYINAVVEQGGLIPHFVSGDDVGPLSNLDEVYDFFDDGLVSGTQHLVCALIRSSRDAGVRVILDGFDGDNVISHGHLYLKELVEAGEWEAFSSEIRMLAQNYREASHKHGFEETLGSPGRLFNAYAAPYLRRLADRAPWWRFLKEIGAVSNHLPMSRRYLLRFYWKRLVRPYTLVRLRQKWRQRQASSLPDVPETIDPTFAQRIGLAQRLAHYSPPEEQDLLAKPVREAQRNLLATPRFAAALASTDHMGAMFTVEVRHPFMDKRLVEFCLALPPNQSLRHGWTRLILRRALAYTLPEKVTWRAGKARMTSSYKRALFDLDADLLREHISNLGPLEKYTNSQVIHEMYEKGRALAETEQVRLAEVAVLSLWLKKRFAAGEMADTQSLPA